MTTKEKILANKIKSLDARWRREMEDHERLYERRFNSLPTNEAGETSAKAILELNEWSRTRIAEIRKRWDDGLLNAIKA